MNQPPIKSEYPGNNQASDLLKRTIRSGGAYLLLPAIIALAALCLFPLGRGIARAVTGSLNSDISLPALTNREFLSAVGTAALTTALSAIFTNILAFSAARLMVRCGRNDVIAAALCVPWMMGIAAVGAGWQGLGGAVISFTGASVLHNVLMLFWQQFGIVTLIYAAGLRAVPQCAVDESILQGMTGMQALTDMQLPRMRPWVCVSLLITVLLSLRSCAMSESPQPTGMQLIVEFILLAAVACAIGAFAGGREVCRA